jgi:hypothetical protein
MVLGFLTRFTKRTLLYQIFLVFSWLRWLNLEKSAVELKDKVVQLTQDCPCLKEHTAKAFKDPILAFKVFLGLQVGCAAVAILGLPFLGKLAGFLCAVLLTANIFIYELTLPGEGKPVVWKNWESLITPESIISAVVVVGILAHVFKSGHCATTAVDNGKKQKQE